MVDKSKIEKKEFDSVAYFRNVKEQMAKYLEGKSFSEQKEILRKIQSGEIKILKLSKNEKTEYVRDKKKSH
ncbi:MAG: hypothetical protein WAT71_06165 [Ignavibacteria bacterium]